MDWYFVGVDFGQSRDYTAIAAMERVELVGAFDGAVWAHRKTAALRLRFLERIALGTPYPEVVERVVQVTRDPKLAGRCHLAVDGTGVGRPVVDLLRRAKPEGILQAVTITSGQVETTDQGFYRVPKRDLIVGLQVLLQEEELQISRKMAYAEKLAEEMLAMQVRVSAAGNEQYAAWREGTHDDLVFAAALAYWSSRKAFPQGAKEQWWTNGCQEDAAAMFRKWKWEEERRVGRWC